MLNMRGVNHVLDNVRRSCLDCLYLLDSVFFSRIKPQMIKHFLMACALAYGLAIAYTFANYIDDGYVVNIDQGYGCA